ncbi:MAG: ATP-dependent helicase [Flavobacterium sp.]|nr:ATP-dependent helicase [Flavobacterium sp.]
MNLLNVEINLILSNQHQFCYDISMDEKLGFFVPTAYIIDNCDKIQYVNKKATPLIIKSFGIVNDGIEPNTKTLLSIIDVLKPENLFKKFEKNLKSKKTIQDLLIDEKIGKILQNYVQAKINQFLEIIVQNNLPLSLNLSKDKDFYKSRIETQNPKLETKLFFDKNQSGMQYSLQLSLNSKLFFPSERKIKIIINEPSWLVVDNKLFQLSNVNCNKLKPFLDKKIIEVKTEIISEFFNKFIKDIVNKVDIDAKGFNIVQKNKIISCKIIPVENFFKNNYNLELIFDYDGYSFANHANKKNHSSLDNDSNNEIEVIQFKRNFEQEMIFEQKLINLGFEKNEDNLFVLANKTKDEFETIYYLIENLKTFQDKGFLIENIAVSNKKIQTEVGTISVSSQQSNDWFDVKMIIKCGNFEFNFSEIIDNIKLRNRFFKLPDETYFLIPEEWFTKYVAIANFAKIKNGTINLPKSNYTILEKIESINVSIDSNKNIDYQPSNSLKATLRPYQIDGVKWLLKNFNAGLGACLADDMGLGKTLQTLAALVNIQENLQLINDDFQDDLFSGSIQKKEYLKALIVAPSSLVFNWYNESRKFTPHFRRIQYIGNDRKSFARKLDKYDVIFTSYSIVTKDVEIFKKFHFKYLIIDESQQIKNRDSKVFKAINEIVTDHKISLSGTPIENSLNDLWSQMQFINPDILGDFKFFTNYFKIPIEKNQDLYRITELKSIVNPFILRRTKDQVLDDLPELSEQIVICEMEHEQQKWYESEKSKARNEFLKMESVNNRINVLNVLMKLRQISNHPKMLDKNTSFESGKFFTVTNYLQTLLQSDHKILVFSSFVTHLKLYENWCKENKIDFCKLTGNTKREERQFQVQKFQENTEVKIFFISLKSGGVGLNLTSASYVLLLDPWWNPFAEKQAIARAHRIGQTNKVNAVRFISKDTIEEKIILLQEKKQLLSESILQIDFIPQDLDSNLNFLLE